MIDLEGGLFSTRSRTDGSDTVVRIGSRLEISLGPALRLLLAGLSPVAEACAQFARALGFEVIACDPREEVATLALEGVTVIPLLPSIYIANGGCHEATAVVALTHDPRIDDLALMEAVHTPAFYIGAMGSKRTSERRAERLRRIGGLSAADVARLHMPIGLDIGSRTPPKLHCRSWLMCCGFTEVKRERRFEGSRALRVAQCTCPGCADYQSGRRTLT